MEFEIKFSFISGFSYTNPKHVVKNNPATYPYFVRRKRDRITVDQSMLLLWN